MTTQKTQKNNDKVVKLVDYTPSAYLIDDTYLDFHLSPKKTIVHATLHMSPNPASSHLKDTATNTIKLDGEKLNLQSIHLNDIMLDSSDYEVSDKHLIVKNVPKETFTLTTICHIHPEKNSELNGLYLSRNIYCSQCEAEGFRRITYFFDRPDILSRFHVRIQSDASTPFTLSNGNCIAKGVDAKTEHHYTEWENPYPMPCYLFALVAGDFDILEDSYTTKEKRHVVLRIYVEKGKKERSRFAMQALKRAMHWDEKVYGFAYDLDIFMVVAISDFNMGAMENKGLNIFNDKYLLADPQHATDNDYQNIERIIAHEYFHNWTGNRITCRDWFQLCLKEGLTVFREQQYCADQFSPVSERIKSIHFLHRKQFIDDAGPLAHPVRPDNYIEINNFYNATVYEKGAELFRMIFIYLGKDNYYKGITQFFDDHDGTATCIEDILRSFAKANPQHHDFLTIHFLNWYSQAGTPEVIVKTTYDHQTKSYTIALSQSLPINDHNKKLAIKDLPIPLQYGLIDSQGNEITCLSTINDHDNAGCHVTPNMITLTAQKGHVRFDNIKEKPTLSILRNFSAPINISYEQSNTELAHIVRYDTDPINQWQAIQKLYHDHIKTSLNAHNINMHSINDTLIECISYIIKHPTFSSTIKQSFLTIPHYSEIALKLHHDIDPSKIFKATHALQKTISTLFCPDILNNYHHHATQLHNSAYKTSPKDIETRSYKNFLLWLYGCSQPQACEKLAQIQYQKADNLTDQLGAIRSINDIDCPTRTTLLSQLISNNTHSVDALLLDKYLSMHAISQLEHCLDNVQSLTLSNHFDIKNPNKIFALLGSFAFSNPLRFHSDNGKSYRFIAKHIIKIDRFNPQIASRLMSAFSSVSTLNKNLQRKMLPEIEKIMSQADISRNTLEIGQKILSNPFQ